MSTTTVNFRVHLQYLFLDLAHTYLDIGAGEYMFLYRIVYVRVPGSMYAVKQDREQKRSSGSNNMHTRIPPGRAAAGRFCRSSVSAQHFRMHPLNQKVDWCRRVRYLVRTLRG